MLVNLACDWGRPSRDWPCAWTPSDYYRFLLSVSRNRFLSTDLQSAFWKRFGKEPSFGFPMDLTNLHALLIDQKGGLSKRIDFASTRIQAARYTSLLPYGRIGVQQPRANEWWQFPAVGWNKGGRNYFPGL